MRRRRTVQVQVQLGVASAVSLQVGSFIIHMAAAWGFIVFWCAGSVLLDSTSHILNAICGTKGLGLVWLTVPIGALLLLVESCLLNHEEQQPQRSDACCLVILIVCELLLALIYFVVAYSALISDLASTSTPRGGMCELAADGTACAAGVLAAASAVGLLLALCSRLRHPQAPLQPQA